MPPSLHFPAEWQPHDAVWLAWPSHQAPWEDTPLRAVQEEFTALCAAIADPDPATGEPRGEALHILVSPAEAEAAVAALGPLRATFHEIPFGDIWLRDTAPIFLHRGDGRRLTMVHRFNGWGEKFIYPGDDGVAGAIARASGEAIADHDWVLEGGSLESDGEGTLLTTEECLLHPNRNPGLSRAEIERRLRAETGIEKVLWLGDGLAADHTDGHIDNLARFVGPGKVVCMAPAGTDDPNAAVLRATAATLAAMTDARGRRLEVITLPSPGRVLDRHGQLMAASHVNFYIANTTVVYPLYPGSEAAAVEAALQACFPTRRIVGCPAWNILHGGGSFHCITQQVPRLLP